MPAGTPPEVARAANDWPVPGHDYANTRATTTSSINKSNVKQLQRRLARRAGGSRQPDHGAARARRHRVLRGRQRHGLRAWTGPPATCAGRASRPGSTSGRSASRSATAASTRCAAPTASSRSTRTPARRCGSARSRRTRRPASTSSRRSSTARCWCRPCRSASAASTSAGITASSPRSTLRTGKVNWTFDTVDSADLWGNPSVNSGGGAWYPIAVDPKRGVAYAGIANPAPFPGTRGVPQRLQPTRQEPVHRLDRRARPQDREAALVPAGDRARHLRPGPGARDDRSPERRDGHRHQLREVRRGARRRPGQAARCCGARRSATTRTTTCRRSPARRRSRPEPTAAC